MSKRKSKAIQQKELVKNINSTLNDDCLFYIFSFVPIIERVRLKEVCRRWRAVGQLPWHDMQILNLADASWSSKASDRGFVLSFPVLERVLQLCGPFLTCLDFGTLTGEIKSEDVIRRSRSLQAHKKFFSYVSDACPNIKRIDISLVPLTDAGLKTLAQNFRDLVELSISDYHGSNCEDSLATLFANSKSLRTLKLKYMDLTGTCLTALSMDCMEEIVMCSLHQIQAEHFLRIIQVCPKLRKLIIEATEDIAKNAHHILPLVAANAFDFRELKINQCQWSSSPIYKVYLSRSSFVGLTNLRTLELNGNVVVNDEVVCSVAANCALLTHAYFSGFSGYRAGAAAYCSELTDKGLISLTDLPELQHLGLEYFSKITGSAFVGMTNLRSITCGRCPKLKSSGLAALMKISQNLETLNIDDCHAINSNLLNNCARADNRKDGAQSKITIEVSPRAPQLVGRRCGFKKVT